MGQVARVTQLQAVLALVMQAVELVGTDVTLAPRALL